VTPSHNHPTSPNTSHPKEKRPLNNHEILSL
jgi:hypothetical protein